MPILSHSSILSILTLISRILGLVREMVKASLLGTSVLSDAFSVAFLIPNLFRRLFAEGSISAAFIPTFKEYLLEKKTEDIREFLSCTLTFLTFFVTLAVLLGILGTPFLAPVFGVKAFDETVLLTRMMFPFLAFISVAAFFQGILNSLRIFTPSGLAPILLNLATIGAAYAFSPFTANPARAMAVGILLGGFLEAAVQFPFILRKGYRFFFVGLKRAVMNPGVKTVLRLIGPTIIGMAAYQLNDLVSTALAGNAGEGVVSSLQYSLRLQELILGVFAVSIGTVLLPDLAEYVTLAQWEQYNERLIKAINIIAFITVPITFFSLAQGELLIRLIFQNRSFGEDSVRLTLGAFTFHIPGLFFIALNRILAPAFYAQNDSKSPSLAGIISFGVNIVLALLLSAPLRGSGIALALSLAGAVNTALLLMFLKKNPRIAVKRALHSALMYTLKLSLFSVLAILPVLWLSPRLLTLFAGQNRFIAYGLPLTLCAAVYGAAGVLLLFLAKDPQITGVLYILKKHSRKSKKVKK
ncbi:MAG: murein biosynthesis integral membrane protein MurJ [Spirochaetaceae bacterium]|jgi:putative peptidoglycan lipid II flippase|nr:murein biosynthesis integral membrane protein MurJ [Spirochaetaceae bacterium]